MYSVLITTKDRQNLVDRQIELFEKNKSLHSVIQEIIVYDDASDCPLKVKNVAAPPVKLIRGDKTVGLIKARNILIENSNKESQYCIFIDDDIFIYNMEYLLLSRVPTIFSDLSVACLSIPFLNLPTVKGAKLSYFKYIYDFRPDCKEVVYFHGGSSIFRKSIFNDVGLLESRYFFALEEEDLALRLFCNGYKLIVEFNQNIFSIHDQALGKRWDERYIFLLSNRMLFHYKYLNSFITRYFLNTIYFILYISKIRNITGMRKAILRYKDIKSTIVSSRISTSKFVKFLIFRYLHL